MAKRNLLAKIANATGVKSEKGVSAIEYGLMAALIALAIIAAVTLVGTNLGHLFNNVANNLNR